MAGSDKIKIIDNKIKQNKAQYNLDRPTAKIVTLSLEHVITFEILTGEDVLPEKRLVNKSSCNQKIFVNIHHKVVFGKAWNKKSWHCKKHSKGLDKVYEFDKG